MSTPLQLSGLQFGRLTVMRREGTNISGQGMWRCKCRCGKETVTAGPGLVNGHAQSCGCLQKETAAKIGTSATTHGHSKNRKPSTEYNSWRAMIQRCEYPKHRYFKNYGGRGIKLCKRWRSFANFLGDMGLKPTPKHTIERKNNDGNYTPNNCRWATRKEQAANTRRKVRLGQTTS